MHRRRDRVDGRELTGHRIAVRRQRQPQSFAVSRRDSDDHRLRSDAAARDRFTKRLVELRVFDRLCAGHSRKQRHRYERRTRDYGER